MSAITCALLLAATLGPTPGASAAKLAPAVNASQQKLVEQLKANIFRTDRAIAITEEEVGKTRLQPYAPEIQFRLAELYVEKSRYLYLLHQQEVGVAAGSQIAPEVRLIKQKAMGIYETILRDAPEWTGTDRVRFYLAHELRELGQFDRMVELEEELATKNPKSPLVPEALVIVGDHWFDSSDLTKAEAAYHRVLALPPSPSTDLARFKMGWVRLNQSRHKEAVEFFEATAASPVMEGASAASLNVKREALFDLVYSFTESHPWKGAVEYFEKLATSQALLVGVLEKLANRYYIKQEYEGAVPVYRRLIDLSRNPDRDVEFAERLYQCLKAVPEKAPATGLDVANIVRIAARVRTNEHLDAATRKSNIDELEIYSRDLSTGLLIEARQVAGVESGVGVGKPVANKAQFSEAADALESWLSLFRESAQKLAMERNYADALFVAERWHEAGRAFEIVAKESKDATEKEDALYNSLAAYARAVPEDHTSGVPMTTGLWRVADARRAMGLLGATYVAAYPKSTRVAKVKFNVARASYEAGDWKHAAELFAAFVKEHPDASDAGAAANLALDSLHLAADFEGLEKTGNAMMAVEGLSPSVKKDIQDVVEKSRSERLSTVALQSSAASGDAAKGLVELAQSKAGSELGEQALFAAFATYREKKDFAKVLELSRQFEQAYPKSSKLADALATVARAALELADYDLAAASYERLFDRFPKETAGLDAGRTAATLSLLLGDAKHAASILEKLPAGSRAGAQARQLAEAKLAAGDTAGAQAAAEVALDADGGDAEAGILLGQSLLAQHKATEAVPALKKVIAAARKSSVSEDALSRLWDVMGEAALQVMLGLPADPLDPNVAALKEIQQATTALIQLAAGPLAVKGLYRLAVAFDHLGTAVAGLPAPAKLSASDQAKVLAAFQQQATGLHNNAKQEFDACAQKGRELQVMQAFVAACAAGAKAADETLEPQLGSPPSQGGAIATARADLKWGTPSAEKIDALGVAQLAAGDYHRARLTFQRALEVENSRPSSLAGLGEALAHLGETDSARAAFRQALELDSGNDRAHAGLATLFCKFGDTEKAKAELDQVKDKANAADPELLKCR
jgi:tetratricopeptide (TPR) repeat protein